MLHRKNEFKISTAVPVGTAFSLPQGPWTTIKDHNWHGIQRYEADAPGSSGLLGCRPGHRGPQFGCAKCLHMVVVRPTFKCSVPSLTSKHIGPVPDPRRGQATYEPRASSVGWSPATTVGIAGQPAQRVGPDLAGQRQMFSEIDAKGPAGACGGAVAHALVRA
jgi:hypothetical protein